jgi:hypothetical protein
MVGQQPAQVKLQHSVKVPQFYKTAANIAKRASEERRSLKDLVFNANKHLVSSAFLSLVTAQIFWTEYLWRVHGPWKKVGGFCGCGFIVGRYLKLDLIWEADAHDNSI